MRTRSVPRSLDKGVKDIDRLRGRDTGEGQVTLFTGETPVRFKYFEEGGKPGNDFQE